ncbi:hypothetical protein CON20_27480, partial [Priestia megaterium]
RVQLPGGAAAHRGPARHARENRARPARHLLGVEARQPGRGGLRARPAHADARGHVAESRVTDEDEPQREPVVTGAIRVEIYGDRERGIAFSHRA